MEEPEFENALEKAPSDLTIGDYAWSSSASEELMAENNKVIDLFDPVDAMSLNSEKDRVIVSGIRGVLQIIKIQHSPNDIEEGPSIVKDLDMRVYRKGKVNILYSAQNVKWNQLYSQYIATTSSNGSIVCWNISRRNKSVYKSHERSATCLDWHATAPYILVSGSRDCTVKSYDMRVQHAHQLSFSDKNCESVRDIAMCKAPGLDDYFFTGDDGGVLRLWDLRQTKKWVFQKVAHRSFVSSISLNPNDRSLIATGGGRDKLVKIWEWTGGELKRWSVLETTAPLGRVIWRPDQPYHLATCASVNEASIHIWDVRRPYLPYVTYDEHRDSVTDACWPSADQDVFLSCGKDGLVVLHKMDSGQVASSYACDVAFDITPDGTIGVAVNSEINSKNEDEEDLPFFESEVISTPRISFAEFERPIKSVVTFGIPESLTHSLPPNIFYQIAEKYLIGGCEISQLCEINSKVAIKAALEHVAQTWRLVEALCEQARIQEEYDKATVEEKERMIRAWIIRKKELAEEGRRWLANRNDYYLDNVKKYGIDRLENTQHVTAFLNFASSSSSEEEEEKGEKMSGKENNGKPTINSSINSAFERAQEEKKKKRKRKTAAATDFYFGAGEANFKGGKREILHHNEFMGLKDEAFETRDEEKERKFFCKARKQPRNAAEYDMLQEDLRKSAADFHAWSPMLEIYRLLIYHAEQGDMQTCATISMVCGKRLFDAVDPYTINGWIQCYMEMLDRLELYLVCAKIRKYCTIDCISSVSRENTTIQLAHADCGSLVVNGRCTKCESLAQADCTVCRFAIVGMTYQCNICGHCMHADHAYEWFKKTKECAFVGCPCSCGENTWPDMERTFIPNDEVKRGHRKFNRNEQSETSNSRVDISRLDTDSEDSPDDDSEWTPATDKIKEKFGDLPSEGWNTPEAQHLFRLYRERYRKTSESMGIGKVKVNEPSSTSQKELEKDALQSVLQQNLDLKFDSNRDLIEPNMEESEREIMDGEEFVESYLNPKIVNKEELEDTKRGKSDRRQNYRKAYMEQIEEEAEDDNEDEEEFDDEEIEESSSEDGVDDVDRVDPSDSDDVEEYHKHEPINGRMKNGDNEYAKDKGVDFWDDFYSDEYIDSIGPIGLQAFQTEYLNRTQLEENERVTSPIIGWDSLKKNIEESRRMCSDKIIISAERKPQKNAVQNLPKDESEIMTEKEGRVKKTKTAKEKALIMLNMDPLQRKKEKKKRQNKRIDQLFQQRNLPPNSYSFIEDSSDGYSVSSLSDDSSNTSSFSSSSTSSQSSSSASEMFIPVSSKVSQNINEGYNAESESSMSDGDLPESAQSLYHLPSPKTTVDFFGKDESFTEEVKHKFKKFNKVSNAVICSSDEGGRSVHADNVFICIRDISPAVSSTSISTLSVSPVPSIPSSRFSSPSPPSSHKTKIEPKDPKVSEDDVQKETPAPSAVSEIIPATPEKGSPHSSITSIPIIEPPTITSYANPIFSRITGRPPRSRPVTISGDRYLNDMGPVVDDGLVHSAPGNNVNNGSPKICSSLPTKPISRLQALDPTVKRKLSSSSRDHLLVTDLPHSSPGSKRAMPLSFENKLFESSPKFQPIDADHNQTVVQNVPKNGVESDLFTTDEDGEVFGGSSDPSGQEDGEEFFPKCQDVTSRIGNRHPWETDEQYELRRKMEAEEEEEIIGKTEKLETPSSSPSENIFVNKNTPMARELAKRKRRFQLKMKKSQNKKDFVFSKPVPALKRVQFTVEDSEKHLNNSLNILKSELPPEISIDSDYESFVREKEVCRQCKNSRLEDKKEKQYVQWLRNVAEENQMFFAKSLSDPCAIFQLSHLDSYITDAEKARKTALHMVEFIKVFYFVEWEDLLHPDKEFMLKEIYELWQDYQKKRPRVCRTHFRDYQFKFFASSIATKIKRQLYLNESPQTLQSAISYDWLHLKPCVNTGEDDSNSMDEIFSTVVSNNPRWTIEQKKAANQYWDMFGHVPVHVGTSAKEAIPPKSEVLLEIIDDDNYWTKKMMRSIMLKKRSYDIKLGYTKRKKEENIFYAQEKSKKILSREWRSRLDKMINETRHVDFSTSSFKIHPREKLIHTADPEFPWPVCQFENGVHLVTVQPMVTRRLIQFKSRVRSKFHIRRNSVVHKNSEHVEITMDELRKLPSFKRFEPRLKKSDNFKEMMMRHFKVIDREVAQTRYHLYPIIEETAEVDVIIRALENGCMVDAEGLDAEDILAERRTIREAEDRWRLGEMAAERYRKDLANTKKLEYDKIKIFKKHWMPEFRKKVRTARKVIEIGRLVVEEDVKKWMEYQYELTFMKKEMRKRTFITKLQMKDNAPAKWFDAIDQTDFTERRYPPPYVNPVVVPVQKSTPKIPKYNSSSDSDEYDTDDEIIPEIPKVQFETRPHLVTVAAELQTEVEKTIELVDRDSDWMYSDDSSIETWFGDPGDDVVNRLLNVDYLDENMILKERAMGAIGKKLIDLIGERKDPEPLTDEEEDVSLERIEREAEEEERADKMKKKTELGDLRDVGVPDDNTRNEVRVMESHIHNLRKDRKEEHQLERETLRLFFKQYALDHSYALQPYDWDPELKDAIAYLHKNELRRVGNRNHQKMKEEYNTREEQNQMIAEILPADENSLPYKFICYLLFRGIGESFDAFSRKLDENKKIMKPLKLYDMFFGTEGVCALKLIGDRAIQNASLRSSFHYIIKTIGEDMKITSDSLRRFLKLWWYNSRVTLEDFLNCCESTLVIENQIDDDIDYWYYFPANLDIARETYDRLEISSLVNEMLFTVEQFVDETEIMFQHADSDSERIAFATMDIFGWCEIKTGFPDWREGEPPEVDTQMFSSESSLSDGESSSTRSNSHGNPEVLDTPTNSEGSTSDSYKPPIQFTASRRRQSENNDKIVDLYRRNSRLTGKPNIEMMSNYSKIYRKLKELEEEKRKMKAEEVVRKNMRRWKDLEQQQKWEADDMERKIHDFLMMKLTVAEKVDVYEDVEEELIDDWRKVVDEEDLTDIPNIMLYAKKGLPIDQMLEMCGLPVNLDTHMFHAEMQVCQSTETSIEDADEMRDLIEEGWEEDDVEFPSTELDDDAESYSSVKHVLKHELYFQRDVYSRRVPSCVVLFTPDQFFENFSNNDYEFIKWKRIIEGSECPYSFNKLVMRERLLRKCRQEYRYQLLDKYFQRHEQKRSDVLKIFRNLLILVVVDTELNPWSCRIVSNEDFSGPVGNRFGFIRRSMIEDSQEHLENWLRLNKIDMEVYSRCPLIIARDEDLTFEHVSQMSTLYVEEQIREEWHVIMREEGVSALDAMIRMPPVPAHKLDIYKVIFKPIYDSWFNVWSFENSQSNSKTLVVRKFDERREYLQKARIIVNYAHQHYRMKRFDTFMSKDPTEYQLVDRSDVPSASLFDSLDAAVSKFCNEDSPHLDEPGKQIVKDTLIQLATGKIPYFTSNYFGGYDYTEDEELKADDEDEENDDDKAPILKGADVPLPVVDGGELFELDDCSEEFKWLRSMYEDTDWSRRQFMACLMFEIAQKAMFRFAPNIADFKRAQKKFERLLTVHGKQRPLLDMMITKVRGTYFMPFETKMFLYNMKLITFGELEDSEIHPKHWKEESEDLEEIRKLVSDDPRDLKEFVEGQLIGSDEDSVSEVSSDFLMDLSPSSLGSLESLNSSKSARPSVMNRGQRELILASLRSSLDNSDDAFAEERRALGYKRWRVRRRLGEALECISDLDRNKIEAKLPAKKQKLLKLVTDLIVNNAESAHWSWGELKMQTRSGRIPPVHRMKPKHFLRIERGEKLYKPPNENEDEAKQDDLRDKSLFKHRKL